MKCCVEGCPETGTHKRIYVITSEPVGGEYEVDSYFCCKHLDKLMSEEPPFLDLVVVGRFRET